MKKIIFGMLFILACGVSFTGCSKSDDGQKKHATAPETASAGTYAGTWSKQLSGSEDVTTGEGTLVLAPATDADGNAVAYATNVTVASTMLGLNKTSIANIVWVNDDFTFSNPLATNGFGSKFTGRVLSDGSATISFTITEKQGRKTFNYVYSFTGNKQ